MTAAAAVASFERTAAAKAVAERDAPTAKATLETDTMVKRLAQATAERDAARSVLVCSEMMSRR